MNPATVSFLHFNQLENEPELKVLIENEERLIEILKTTNSDDLLEFCKDLRRYKILTEITTKRMASLDYGNLDNKLIIRYLLQLVCEGVKDSHKLCDKFLKVLRSSDLVSERGKSSAKSLTDELNRLRDGEEQDPGLSAEDLAIIMDILNEYAYQWENIGISLGLPPNVLKNIDEDKRNVKSKLYAVLTNSSETKIHLALNSTLVGLPKVASDIDRKLKNAKHVCPAKVPLLEASIEYQSFDISITDGKAALLEVQVISDELVSYQWMKDSKCLTEGEIYCGTNNNILLIYPVNQETEGKYTCKIVSVSMEKICETISLQAIFSEHKKNLLDKYKMPSKVSEDLGSFNSIDQYLDLTLIKVQNNSLNYCIQGDLDNFLENMERITYEEVFGKYESGALIVVEGRPGSGKTTLACKVARDWAVDGSTIKNADYVVLLSFRGHQEDLLDIANKQNGEGFCFIIDGLDEQSNHDLLKQVLSLSKAMVITMSRPAATITLRKRAKKRIAVLGFRKKQIYDYIERFSFDYSNQPNTVLSSELKAYINKHAHVLQMCHLPLHTAFICFIFDHCEGNMPQTETQIYYRFTCTVILHKLQRDNFKATLLSLDDLNSENKENFNKVCKLAFEMMCEHENSIKCKDMPFDILSPISSLLTTDSILQIYGIGNVLSFLHFTLQEYLAAYHIASLPTMEQKSFINKYGEKDYLQTTWKFYCGIEANSVDKAVLFEDLMNVVGSNHVYKACCAYESQKPALCIKLIQMELGHLKFRCNESDESDLTAVSYVVDKASSVISGLSMELFSFSQVHNMLDFINASKVGIKRNPVFDKVFDDERKTISLYATSFSKASQEDYKKEKLQILQYKSWLENTATTQLDKVFDLKTLNMTTRDFLNVGSAAMNTFKQPLAAPMVKALQSCTNLHTLDLFSCCIGSDGAPMIAEVLKHCTCLQTLDMSATEIGFDGAIALSKGLQHSVNLEFLSLAANRITLEGVQVIAEATKGCMRLKDINISNNNIGAVVFSEQPNLQRFEMSATNIGPFCSNNMVTFPSSLQVLILSHNNIDCNGALAIARAIESCPDLCELILSHNNIENKGAEVIVDSLSDSVRELDLSNNRISQDCTQLARKLESRSDVQFKFLNDCNTLPSGLSADNQSLCSAGLEILSELLTELTSTDFQESELLESVRSTLFK